MVLNLNLSADESAAVQAQTDAFNAAGAANAVLLKVKAPTPLTVEQFMAHQIQILLLDRFVSRAAEDQQNALIDSILALPPDKRAEVQASVATISASVGPSLLV